MAKKQPPAAVAETILWRELAAQVERTRGGLRILCVTRAYPPVVGGMEKLSFEFTQALSRVATVDLVANRGGKRALPFFLPRAAVQLRRLAPHMDVIHLGDPLLTALLPVLGSIGPRRPIRPIGQRRARRRRPLIAVTIHGLDIRYRSALYQSLIRRFLPRLDLALCISRFVEDELRPRFPTVRTFVMNPGLEQSFHRPGATRAELGHVLGRTIHGGPLLLAVARLVPRKGLAWFVEAVLPSLPDAHLLIIGDGPEHKNLLDVAARARVRDRVLLAGAMLSTETLKLAYSTADLLVMPNVPVAGDAEGFGLVAIEAASAGLPVVAADLEGIRDAVVAGETGVLVPPGNADAWASVLTRLLGDGEARARLAVAAPAVVRERFSWDTIAPRVVAALAAARVDAPRPGT